MEDIRKIADQSMFALEEKDPEALHRKLREFGLEPGDIYQELEMTSRYVETHQDVTYSQIPVSLHSHTYYEILYCRDAGDVEYLVGAERYRLQKGDVVIVPPGISHKPLLPQHMIRPYIRDVLWASQDMIDEMAAHWESASGSESC